MLSEKPNTTSMATRWYVLVVMMLVYTLSIADRYVVSTVLDDIKRDLSLTDQGVAMLSSWPLALFYVVLGFPVSYILDRHNRTKIVAVTPVRSVKRSGIENSLFNTEPPWRMTGVGLPPSSMVLLVSSDRPSGKLAANIFAKRCTEVLTP